MEIDNFNIYQVHIPFRFSFSKQWNKHKNSESIVVVLKSTCGLVGYGEGIINYNLEELESSEDLIRNFILHLKEIGFPTFDAPVDIEYFINQLNEDSIAPSLICAIEIALLDLMGQCNETNVATLLGVTENNETHYSGILPIGPEQEYLKHLYQLKELEFKHIKISVGHHNDERRLQQARKFLGNDVDIRVFVSNQWDYQKTVSKIKLFESYGIAAIEDPVIGDSLSDMVEISALSNIPIIVDNPFHSALDYHNFINTLHTGTNIILNLKISKIGGILNSLNIFDLAQEKNIACQLGNHIGESAILSAAGKMLGHARPFKYVEAFYGKFFPDESINIEFPTLDFAKSNSYQETNGLGLQAF